MREKWKPIPGYEKRYEASTLGRIKRLPHCVRRSTGVLYSVREKILYPTIDRDGYLLVGLRPYDGAKAKQYRVHHLILFTFVGMQPEGCQGRHFPDRNPQNNTLKNLSWGTPKQQWLDKIVHGTTHHGERQGMSKLKEAGVIEIRRLYATGMWTQTELALKFGVEQTNIGLIVRGKSWRHLLTTDNK